LTLGLRKYGQVAWFGDSFRFLDFTLILSAVPVLGVHGSPPVDAFRIEDEDYLGLAWLRPVSHDLRGQIFI
jgi:hypothetical protein